MTPASVDDGISVGIVSADTFNSVTEFAAHDPILRADFASLAATGYTDPPIIGAWHRGMIVAAAIDDGLAMSIAGTHEGITAIGRHRTDLASKLVISGRQDDVVAITELIDQPRHLRPEHFMTVRRGELRVAAESLPMRVATEHDLPILTVARVRALEEEYRMEVPRGGKLYHDLADALARAVAVQGVAIWCEDDGIAFTAQLIAKTSDVAIFGDLYTDPHLRGAGRATRGLAAFCAWLMTESEYVGLRVGVENFPARRLYDRVGFRVIEAFASSLRPDARHPS